VEDRTATVAIAKGRDRVECIDNAFRHLGGIEQWVKPGMRILLKPNIMSAGGAPLITHIDMLKGLYRLCRDAGAREVTVGENSVCGLEPRRQFEYTGYYDALKRLGVRFAFFDEEEWVYRRGEGNRCLKDMHIPRSLAEADLWITVPVAKTHVATGSTLGIKNSHGILADEDKARHHRTRPSHGSSLWDKFIDILAVARPGLCVTDMFHAMEGQGPGFGGIVEMGLVVASEDIVACDAVVDALMGFGNLENPLPRMAQERGLGVADLGRIQIKGEHLEDHGHAFTRAVSGEIERGDEGGLVVLRGDVCKGGCGMPLSYIIDSFKMMLGRDLRELGPLYVLCGMDPPPPPERKFIFVFGDCAIYSTWNYAYRTRPEKIGPWWKPIPGYVDVPGCCPLALAWLRDFVKLIRGYAPMISSVSMVDYIESSAHTFGEGVPLEKNPRRWQWDPEFAEKYKAEIAASDEPAYIYDDESLKGNGDR